LQVVGRKALTQFLLQETIIVHKLKALPVTNKTKTTCANWFLYISRAYEYQLFQITGMLLDLRIKHDFAPQVARLPIESQSAAEMGSLPIKKGKKSSRAGRDYSSSPFSNSSSGNTEHPSPPCCPPSLTAVG
jgi:hypothetical protein